jgi:hypothetical protein
MFNSIDDSMEDDSFDYALHGENNEKVAIFENDVEMEEVQVVNKFIFNLSNLFNHLIFFFLQETKFLTFTGRNIQKLSKEDQDEIIQFYVHKADIALYDSFVNHPDICIWRKDGKFLLQKYCFLGFDESQRDDVQRLFISSSIFSYWHKDESDYLEIEGKLYQRLKKNVEVVRLLHVDEIERKCNAGNFKELNLPFVPCACTFDPIKRYYDHVVSTSKKMLNFDNDDTCT